MKFVNVHLPVCGYTPRHDGRCHCMLCLAMAQHTNQRQLEQNCNLEISCIIDLLVQVTFLFIFIYKMGDNSILEVALTFRFNLEQNTMIQDQYTTGVTDSRRSPYMDGNLVCSFRSFQDWTALIIRIIRSVVMFWTTYAEILAI